MDNSNLEQLRRMRPGDAMAELDLFLRRYDLAPDEVPDPYYGGEEGFERVLDLLEQACDGLLRELRGRYES
ncbi:Low molecular weight phosphotyrosine protein phosphatase [compost metagenome]